MAKRKVTQRPRPSAATAPRSVKLWPWLVGVLAVTALIVYFQASPRSDGDRDPTLNGNSEQRPTPTSDPVAVYDYQVVNTYPHDREAYTQGLIFRNGFLFESTGLNGKSSLRKVRLETGHVVQQIPIDAQHFAEGLADYGNRLYQLTWRSNVGFIYDLETFAAQRTFSYPGEGWGLARDKNRFVMSDGTSSLRFLDLETLRETGQLRVTDGAQPVDQLNELEVVNEAILANVYQTDFIVMISPQSGLVTGRIDLRGILSSADRAQPVDVLNGIAYDADGGRLFVTGKLWPKLFEIRLVKR